jgi:hypothetical protein
MKQIERNLYSTNLDAVLAGKISVPYFWSLVRECCTFTDTFGGHFGHYFVCFSGCEMAVNINTLLDVSTHLN